MSHAHDPLTADARIAEALETLRRHGLRVTAPRKAMLKVLANEHGPFSSEALFQRLKGTRCDLVTVYRSLSAMEAAGVLRRCDFGDGIHRYEFNAGASHHHHVVCRECRKAEIVDLCVVDGIERMLQARGYANVSHVLDLFGICPDCQRKAAGSKAEGMPAPPSGRGARVTPRPARPRQR
jgi:Fur family ferric uptake transcriptional regulator